MAEPTGKKTTNHPRKQFAVPADIAALGNYGVSIIQAMRAEFNNRMSGKRRSKSP